MIKEIRIDFKHCEYDIGYQYDHNATKLIFEGIEGTENYVRVMENNSNPHVGYLDFPIKDNTWTITSSYTDKPYTFICQIVRKQGKEAIKMSPIFKLNVKPSVPNGEEHKEIVPPAFQTEYDRMVATTDEIIRKLEAGEFDGFSPIVTFEPTIDGNRMNVQDKEGIKSIIIKNGEKGQDGKDKTFLAEYGKTTIEEVLQAYNDGQQIILKYNENDGAENFYYYLQLTTAYPSEKVFVFNTIDDGVYSINAGITEADGWQVYREGYLTHNDIDKQMDETSNNPVENGVIKKYVDDELNRPRHTTMVVTAMTEGIGFKADHTANEIKRHADGGGVVILRFNAPDGSGEQSYNYETFKDGYAIFRRAVIDTENKITSRIVIKIDNRYNVIKEDEQLQVVSKNEFDESVQNLDHDKLGIIRYAIATDKVSQAEATEIISNYGNYEGSYIEFLTNGDMPNKTVAYGYLVTNKQGDQFLIVYNLDGTITQFNKSFYEKHNFETFNYINEMVDLDNLTLDEQGQAPFMASVNNAFNRPFRNETSEKGIVTVIAYGIDLQVQIYRDMESNKVFYRKITGLADNHMFMSWERIGMDVDYLKNNYANVIKSNAKGNPITINDSINAKLVDMIVNGSTTQNGVPTPSEPIPIVNGVFTQITNIDKFTLSKPIELSKWDRIVKKDGVWGKENSFMKITYSGGSSEDWTAIDDGLDSSWFYIYFPKELIKDDTFCSSLIRKPLDSRNKEIAYYLVNTDTKPILRVRLAIGQNLISFKEYLKDNPITFYFPKTPSFEPLPQVDQDIFNNLETHYPKTVISTDDGIVLDVKYLADTKNYVDLGKPYELIEKFTMKENAPILIDKEPDGTPYNLKCVVVFIKNTQPHSNFSIRFMKDNAFINDFLFTNNMNYGVEISEHMNGFWRSQNSYGKQIYKMTLDTLTRFDAYKSFPIINKIASNTEVPKDTEIEIYGIRA